MKHTAGSVRKKMRRMKRKQYHALVTERLGTTAFARSDLLPLYTSVNIFLPTIPSLGLGLLPLSTVPCTLLPRFVICDPKNPLSQSSALQFHHVSITSTSSQKWDSSSPTISCHHASELNSSLLHPSMASPGTLCHPTHS